MYEVQNNLQDEFLMVQSRCSENKDESCTRKHDLEKYKIWVCGQSEHSGDFQCNACNDFLSKIRCLCEQKYYKQLKKESYEWFVCYKELSWGSHFSAHNTKDNKQSKFPLNDIFKTSSLQNILFIMQYLTYMSTWSTLSWNKIL